MCRAASTTYLKLACESDRSRAIYTRPSEDGSGDLGFADTAAVVFIVLHSTAILLVKVRDNRSKGYLAQVPPFLRHCAVRECEAAGLLGCGSSGAYGCT